MAILTISRRYGSGGRDIGRAAADLLHYDNVDRRRILADIGKAGQTWGDFAKQFDEKQPSVYERYKWSFRGFVALNQAQILEYALYDNVVIMGRGGNFLLRGFPFAFRIHIKASMEVRIELSGAACIGSSIAQCWRSIAMAGRPLAAAYKATKAQPIVIEVGGVQSTA